MAKKIKEKELENVSGGGNCFTDEYYTLIWCYDSNNKQIDYLETYKTTNQSDAEKIRDEKIANFFATNKAIVRIVWKMYNKNNMRGAGSRGR